LSSIGGGTAVESPEGESPLVAGISVEESWWASCARRAGGNSDFRVATNARSNGAWNQTSRAQETGAKARGWGTPAPSATARSNSRFSGAANSSMAKMALASGYGRVWGELRREAKASR